MDGQILYAILKDDDWPRPDQPHRSAVAAWQRHLDTEETSHYLVRRSCRCSSMTGVFCRAFRVMGSGTCPHLGLR